jgi:hypothetical protein
MADESQELALDVLTPLGFRVRASRIYWEFIVTAKHPAMAGREADVAEALGAPDEVRRSRSDPAVYLFYKSSGARRWVCAVARNEDDLTGFLITAYPTDAIKEGTRIWPA